VWPRGRNEVLTSYCSQWAPENFPKGLADGIDVTFPILNRTNKFKYQTNQQTNRWEFPLPEPMPTNGNL
jgi:hypothetical protein